MAKQAVVDLLKTVDEKQARDLEDVESASLKFGDVTVFIRTFAFGEATFEAKISWPAIGAVDAGTAVEFAESMIKAADFASEAYAAFTKTQD